MNARKLQSTRGGAPLSKPAKEVGASRAAPIIEAEFSPGAKQMGAQTTNISVSRTRKAGGAAGAKILLGKRSGAHSISLEKMAHELDAQRAPEDRRLDKAGTRRIVETILKDSALIVDLLAEHWDIEMTLSGDDSPASSEALPILARRSNEKLNNEQRISNLVQGLVVRGFEFGIDQFARYAYPLMAVNYESERKWANEVVGEEQFPELSWPRIETVAFEDEVAEALHTALAMTWNISAEPKGYQAYKKEMEDQDFPEYEYLEEDGLSTPDSSLPWVQETVGTNLGPTAILYDERKGRAPSRMLIQGLLHHGAIIGANHANRVYGDALREKTKEAQRAQGRDPDARPRDLTEAERKSLADKLRAQLLSEK